MRNLVLLLCLLSPVVWGAPISYPVPGGTAYRSNTGQIAVDPGDTQQTFQYPIMGMHGNEWIPVAVDAMGVVQVSGGGSGGGDVNIFDSAGNVLTSTAGALNVSVVSFPGTVSVTQGTTPWVVSGTVAATQSGIWSTGRTWTLSSGSDSVSASVSNFPALQQVDIEKITGTAPSATNSLPVQITNGTSFVDPTQIRALSSGTDSVTSFQGGSWTVTADAGTGTFQTNVTNASIPVTQSGTWTTGRTWTLNSGTDSVSTTPDTAATATITPVSTVSGSSVTLLATNTNRKGLILFNQSAGNPCYIAFASTASSTTFTFNLVQKGSYHMDSVLYQGPVSAFCSTGTILVTEM